MTTIITFGNFKGGVGKTTGTSLIAYLLSQHAGKKVLGVDTDQQGDLTDEFETTFQAKIDRTNNIYTACLGEEEVKQSIQRVTDNLDVLCGTPQMKDFADHVKQKWNKKADQQYHDKILSYALEEVKDDYDYILLDTNPSIDLLTENVLQATDYVVIPTKTLARDKEDTKLFYNYLADNHEEKKFELLGVMAYLVEDSATDRKVLADYKELFGEYLFNNIIKNSGVVKRWSYDGITEHRGYDKQTLETYKVLLDEVIERLGG